MFLLRAVERKVIFPQIPENKKVGGKIANPSLTVPHVSLLSRQEKFRAVAETSHLFTSVSIPKKEEIHFSSFIFARQLPQTHSWAKKGQPDKRRKMRERP